MLDLLIENGIIVDGSGKDSFRTTIGVKNGKITFNIDNELSKKTIDAKGLVICPGFIDMHTHSDISFVKDGKCESKLFQGVTSEIAGCCGFSFFPSNVDGLERLREFLEGDSLASLSYRDFIEKTGNYKKAINWGSYVGHGALRASVVGFNDKKASSAELDEMKKLLERDLRDGAFGLSLGIAYAPGMFVETEEFIELSKVVAKHNKIVTAHIRNENDQVFDSIEELIQIGKVSGAHVHVSHIKLGFGNWFKTRQLFDLIDKARADGVNITFEQYPYNASSTGLSAVLPDWAHEGGVKKLLWRLKNQRSDVIKGIKESNSFRMGLDRVVVVTTDGLLPDCDGMNLVEIGSYLNLSPEETVIYLLQNSNGELPTIRFTMHDDDVLEIMKREDCVVISDGSSYSLDKKKVKGNPHPRSYGTFPRYLRLNREYQLMSFEKAVYKMTGLPAKLINLEERGLLKEGYHADMVVINQETISDQATFKDSIQRPVGIQYVIVNGQIVIDNEKFTDQFSGEILL